MIHRTVNPKVVTPHMGCNDTYVAIQILVGLKPHLVMDEAVN